MLNPMRNIEPYLRAIDPYIRPYLTRFDKWSQKKYEYLQKKYPLSPPMPRYGYPRGARLRRRSTSFRPIGAPRPSNAARYIPRNRITRYAYKTKNMRPGGFLGREIKFVDQSVSAALTTTFAQIPALPLNGIAQGDTQSTRLGNRASIISIQGQGWIELNGVCSVNLPDFNNAVRLMVFLDTQPNLALPSPTDILLSSTKTQSYRNLDKSQRFRVLWDRRMFLNPIVGSGSGADELCSADRRFPFSYFKKLKVLTQYSGTSNAIGSIVNNSLLFFGFMEDTLATCSIICELRTRYFG